MIKRGRGRHGQCTQTQTSQTKSRKMSTQNAGQYSEFPALDAVMRPTVDTVAAAYYLNRKPQTLRTWACLENGPLRPIRVNGRLAWSVQEIRRLMGGL